MNELVTALRDGLEERSDDGAAPAVQDYLKSAMPFRGVPKPGRERLLRTVLAAHPVPDAVALAVAVDALRDGAAFREEQYLAMALAAHRRHLRWVDLDWLPRLRHWIVDAAWWDVTDELAVRPALSPLSRREALRVVGE